MPTKNVLSCLLLGICCLTLSACSDETETQSVAQSEWLEAYGAQGPFDQVQSTGKADGMGRPGPKASWDNDDYQVWPVSRQWSDISDEAGLGWSENSGMDWNEKYAAWLSSLQTTPQPDNDGKTTFLLTTPHGKSMLAPVLECAEVAIFLRATFASWYQLPFFLEASDQGKRLYLGHFGFRRNDGTAFSRTPKFKTRYADHTAEWVPDNDWPTDAKLRGRGLYGGGDEVAFLGTIDGKPARAGAYFDEIYLNKRVGHFMLLALSWFGSMHLADGSNMFHVKAKHIRAGDVLLLRWQRRGIGHTIPVMRVDRLEESRFEVAVATGSMPRRFPKWEDGPAAGRYFKKKDAGGVGENYDGEAYAKLGGGLRRWRVAISEGGLYRNTFLGDDADHWINSSNAQAVSDRIGEFENLLKELSPEEKQTLALDLIQSARDHLKQYPASCAARTRREEAFQQLYRINETSFDLSPEETDRLHRELADYVFAELIYGKSKTCCWNSSTSAMYEIVMAYNQQYVMDATMGTCNEPVVFMARDVSTEEDGYAIFRSYAESVNQGEDWVRWSEDEACPQAQTVFRDTQADHAAIPYCTL